MISDRMPQIGSNPCSEGPQGQGDVKVKHYFVLCVNGTDSGLMNTKDHRQDNMTIEFFVKRHKMEFQCQKVCEV
ncbi:hypothetical protein evm_004321 [Chilo suppressalis]|nr:hypothetical protein evm_004321 [Chilo suppressalis]